MRARSAVAFAARAARCAASKRAAGAGSVAGSHTASSMPLRMPRSDARAMAQQAVESHAAFGRADFRRVRRRHGGDAIGKREPRLEIADGAVVLDAVDRPRVPRQPERRRADTPGNWPWNARLCTVITVPAAAAAVVQVGGRQARLPVVRVHDVGHELAHGAASHVRRGARERGEAQRVVGDTPSRRRRRTGRRRARTDAARRARAGRARPHARRRRRAGPPNSAGERVHDRRLADRVDHRGIARQQRAHRDLPRAERRRQRAHDVGRGRRS